MIWGNRLHFKWLQKLEYFVNPLLGTCQRLSIRSILCIVVRPQLEAAFSLISYVVPDLGFANALCMFNSSTFSLLPALVLSLIHRGIIAQYLQRYVILLIGTQASISIGLWPIYTSNPLFMGMVCQGLCAVIDDRMQAET